MVDSTEVLMSLKMLCMLYCVVFFTRVTGELMDNKAPKETRERKGTE